MSRCHGCAPVRSRTRRDGRCLSAGAANKEDRPLIEMSWLSELEAMSMRRFTGDLLSVPANDVLPCTITLSPGRLSVVDSHPRFSAVSRLVGRGETANPCAHWPLARPATAANVKVVANA
jgi:hypothetical protein